MSEPLPIAALLRSSPQRRRDGPGARQPDMSPKRDGWRPERAAELRSQGAVLKDALAKARQELRQKKKADKTKLLVWQLAPGSAEGEPCSADALPHFAKVALILFELAERGAVAAAAYLAQQAAVFHWEARPEAAVRELVENLFLKIDLAEYTNLCSVQESSDVVAMRVALAFWAELELVVWVKEANARKGVAPSTASVLDRWEVQRLQWPEDVRPPSKASMEFSSAREWARQFRLRHGGRHGNIRIRDDIPVEEMRSKAPPQ